MKVVVEEASVFGKLTAAGALTAVGRACAAALTVATLVEGPGLGVVIRATGRIAGTTVRLALVDGAGEPRYAAAMVT